MSRDPLGPGRTDSYNNPARGSVSRATYSESRAHVGNDRVRKEREYDEKRTRLEEEFREIDRDNSGFVTQDELFEFMDRKVSAHRSLAGWRTEPVRRRNREGALPADRQGPRRPHQHVRAHSHTSNPLSAEFVDAYLNLEIRLREKLEETNNLYREDIL